MMLKQYIKQIISEAEIDYEKQSWYVKSLFNNFIEKFEDDVMHIRRYSNYDSAHLKIDSYGNYITISDTERLAPTHNFMIAYKKESENNKICVLLPYNNDGSNFFANCSNIYGLYRTAETGSNYEVLISISDFETACSVAGTLEEFFALCSAMNKNQINEAAHHQRNKIDELLEQWIKKFSTSYIEYRKLNYPFPKAYTVKEIKLSNWRAKNINILFNESKYKDYAIIIFFNNYFYISNAEHVAKKSLDARYLAFPMGINIGQDAFNTHDLITLNAHHKFGSLFKLTSADFETAYSVADNYNEFIALCSQMNEEYKKQE